MRARKVTALTSRQSHEQNLEAELLARLKSPSTAWTKANLATIRKLGLSKMRHLKG